MLQRLKQRLFAAPNSTTLFIIYLYGTVFFVMGVVLAVYMLYDAAVGVASPGTTALNFPEKAATVTAMIVTGHFSARWVRRRATRIQGKIWAGFITIVGTIGAYLTFLDHQDLLGSVLAAGFMWALGLWTWQWASKKPQKGDL